MHKAYIKSYPYSAFFKVTSTLWLPMSFPIAYLADVFLLNVFFCYTVSQFSLEFDLNRVIQIQLRTGSYFCTFQFREGLTDIVAQ